MIIIKLTTKYCQISMLSGSFSSIPDSVMMPSYGISSRSMYSASERAPLELSLPPVDESWDPDIAGNCCLDLQDAVDAISLRGPGTPEDGGRCIFGELWVGLCLFLAAKRWATWKKARGWTSSVYHAIKGFLMQKANLDQLTTMIYVQIAQ